MRKKGDSVLISWVLLVGFVVGLAAIVTMWVKDRAESTTQQQIDQAEQELRCADTSMNVAVDCSSSSPDVKVTNTGKFTIQKIKARQPPNDPEDIDQVITPQQTVTLNTNSNFNPLEEFDIVPIIKINEKEVVCSARKITHKSC